MNQSITGARASAASPIAAKAAYFSGAVCVVAFVFTIAIIISSAFRQGMPSTWTDLLQIVAFACIDASPYLGLGTMSFLARRKTSSTIFVAIATIACAAVGAWLIVDVLFVHIDAFAAFMLIIVPIGQWCVVAILAAAMAVGRATEAVLQPKQSSPTPPAAE